MRSIGLLVLVTLCAGLSARAAAEDATTVVLGLRSVEGDDEFANGMTDALRVAARKVSGWKVADRAVSMSQMSLAHGCDDIDAPCLSEIAKGLQADRLLFGSVRRTNVQPKKGYDYEVSVSIFNAGTRSIGSTETQTVSRTESKAKKLSTRAEPIIAKLASADTGSGTLSVQANVANAEIKLDGQVVGQTRDKSLVLEGLKEGEHNLEITAIGHLTHEQKILVASGQRTEIKVSLEPVPEPTSEEAPMAALAPTDEESSGGGNLAWLGYTLIGVGAASLGGWGVSMYLVNDTNNDSRFVQYKRAFPRTTDDVCDLADSNSTASGAVSASQLSDVKSLCSRGRTFNLLQWVFLGAGVLTAGVGTFIVVSESGGSEEQTAKLKSSPQLTWSPEVGRGTLALHGQLTF
ncbi:MAG TPA: PEGA domain-containing protein [Polyangiales bacterium]|nr:PEGA domain-containing protein [Polyangiales bacterium]